MVIFAFLLIIISNCRNKLAKTLDKPMFLCYFAHVEHSCVYEREHPKFV